MLRKAALAALSVSLLGMAACAPIAAHQGFMAIEQSPSDVKVGEDTRSTVLAKLGTPTATSTFDKNTWFYLSQLSNRTSFYKPRVMARDVVAIAFDQQSEQVTSVNTYTLADGRVIAFNGRETPTRGREMSILEQLLGTLGAGGALPPDMNRSPGDHPGDRP
jgi:outer membrane protein assembly factor BamE (lipoprotein component of BamABCDE complex)